jgi:hypothetical protein
MAPKTGRVFDAETFLNSSGLARRRAAYASAAVIFAQGTPADTVLYIQQGSVKLSVLSQAGKEARRSTLQRFRKTAGPHTAPARALRQAGRTPMCPAESIAGSARGNGGDDARVNFFMNKFRNLGFIDYNSGGVKVHHALLSIVLHDHPASDR